ncbi:Uncharacterized protein dnm_030790 [Desulfonema magnum]|uniref:Uncharacterized protein n=1 Tax=Desulfonema magnum TaxID=45655 RepID=A0A975BK09_9BACT|nr:Uncharacterized protein dnm_030790 [Desulfonema magnum]
MVSKIDKVISLLLCFRNKFCILQPEEEKINSQNTGRV